MIEAIKNLMYFSDFMYFVWLIFGFVILIKGADMLVDSAAKLAQLFGVSTFIIGLSVVAFGTSAPETAVGLFSALEKNNQLSLGNVVGACIANIALIIGLTSTLKPFSVEKSVIKREIPMSFAIQALLLILAIVGGTLARVDGFILIILFGLFIYYIAKNSKTTSTAQVPEDIMEINEQVAVASEDLNDKSKILKLSIILLFGLIGLVFGGNLVVENASSIARMFSVSETIIGLTIVSIGTTLPEMVATLTATYRNQSDIALGNIIGSNIFNILCVLGISVSVNPIATGNLFGNITSVGYDMLIMLSITILLFLVTAKNKKIPRPMGITFMAIYASYLIFKVFCLA